MANSSKPSKAKRSSAQRRTPPRNARPAEVMAQAERHMLSWIRSNYSLVLSGLSAEQTRFANARSFANWQNVMSASNDFGTLLGALGYVDIGSSNIQPIAQVEQQTQLQSAAAGAGG